MTYGTIYVVTNKVNHKQYVGQTTRPVEKRWVDHVSSATTKMRGGCRVFSRAIRRYGPDAFVVETVASCDNQPALDMMEEYFIWDLETLAPYGYNLKTGGGNGKHHAETRAKITETLMGHSVSSGARAKMSAAHKGKTLSPEHVAKLSAVRQGHIVSPETRDKISMAQKGRKRRPLSLEHRAKIGAGLTGKKRGPRSPETRAKLSVANKGKSPSSETRAKRSVAMKASWRIRKEAHQ